MLITHEREKLIHSIIYFAENTKFCGKVKLFKLLYFLDFEHFKVAGRSVTGLDYFAWKMGPVPVKLYDEIETPEPDLAASLAFTEIPTKIGRPRLEITSKTQFSPQHFSKRELTLLKSLSDEYENTLADDMIEQTHLENLPWDKVFNKENSPQAHIPYEYSLRNDEFEQMKKLVDERKGLIEAFN